jgi:hypothetical protein
MWNQTALTLLAIWLGSAGGAAQVQVEVLKLEFSEVADQVRDGKATREVQTRVLYLASDGRKREEVLGTDEKVQRVEIQNPIEKSAYVLHPRERTAHRWPIEPPPGKQGITPQMLGERTLQGFSCKGSRATMPGNKHNPKKRVAEVWECKDEVTGVSFLGSVEIRSEDGHSHVRNLVRVHRGVRVDNKMFEVPSGYLIHPSTGH